MLTLPLLFVRSLSFLFVRSVFVFLFWYSLEKWFFSFSFCFVWIGRLSIFWHFLLSFFFEKFYDHSSLIDFVYETFVGRVTALILVSALSGTHNTCVFWLVIGLLTFKFFLLLLTSEVSWCLRTWLLPLFGISLVSRGESMMGLRSLVCMNSIHSWFLLYDALSRR